MAKSLYHNTIADSWRVCEALRTDGSGGRPMPHLRQSGKRLAIRPPPTSNRPSSAPGKAQLT
jgi:hypothetical protein